MKSLIIIVALQALVALTSLNGARAASCLEKLSTYTRFGEERATCVKSLNLTETNVVELQNLKEKQFNDSCLTSCTMKNLQLYNNGTIQKDKMLETLKSEATSEVYENLAKVVETCYEVATAKPSPKPKGDKKEKKNEGTRPPHRHHHRRPGPHACGCKRAAKFVYCVLEKDMNLC